MSLFATVEEKDGSIAELEESIKSSQARVAELEDALAKSQEELTVAMKDMDAMKKKEKLEKRKAGLVEAGLTEEEVVESLANFDSLEDEAFEAVVALMKKKDEKKKEAEAALPPALKEAIEKKKNKEGKDKEADAKPKAGEAEAEVTPELLEEVQTTEATLVVPEEEEVNTTRASIENWLENNVLTKVK